MNEEEECLAEEADNIVHEDEEDHVVVIRQESLRAQASVSPDPTTANTIIYLGASVDSTKLDEETDVVVAEKTDDANAGKDEEKILEDHSFEVSSFKSKLF